MEIIHGQEAMQLIEDANPSIKKENLLNVIKAKFGDVHFKTCSNPDMTVEELLTFLENANKLYFEKGMAKMRTCDDCAD